MEQCFRIALGMVFIIGYLQANPVRLEKAGSFELEDLGFGFLRDVSCRDNVTFTSPTEVQKPCFIAALKCFNDGLKQAQVNCTNTESIEQTLDALKTLKVSFDSPQPATCTWEDEGSRKPFRDFVGDMEKHMERLYQDWNV